jgi:N-acetylmuramoyl-L-alanine amidase
LKNLIKITSVIVFLVILFFLIPREKAESQDTDSRRIYTVIIDAGHGGKDPGTIGKSGVYEKNIVLPIALKVRDFLEKDYTDIRVVMTRDRDEFIEVKRRGQIANEESGNLFISIHCNAKKNEENDKSGFEIYLLDLARYDEAREINLNENRYFAGYGFAPESSRLYSSLYHSAYALYSEIYSKMLETEMIRNTKLPSRGVFQAGFWVLLGASMPTVLIECGYLSNSVDEEFLKSDKGQTEIARSIYKSIRFFKMDYDYENSLIF